jgi:N-acetylglucosaminyldiphosphoundecaprenol N-acetyl-beta-D-mannosaminyltransferase
VDINGLGVHALTPGELVDALLQACAAPRETPLRAGYWNAHTCNLAWRDPAHRATMQAMHLRYPDGMSVVRAMRRRGCKQATRVSAADFMPFVVHACAARGVRMGFVGGAPGIANRCAARFDDVLPANPVVFAHHGYFRPGSPDEAAVARAAREAGVQLLLVGMGSPRQERWIVEHGAATGARALWAVGALFEYHGGERARAPLWMRRSGLEWAFRLALEPRRLAGRYLLGNAEFLLRARRRGPGSSTR